MSTSTENVNPHKTSLYFHKANKFLVIGYLPGYMKWRESGYTRAIYRYIQNCLTIAIFIFITMEIGSFFTHNNLSEKQAGDLLIYSFVHPIITSYCFVLEYHKERIKNLIYMLCVELKNVYNDPEVERQMVKKSTFYIVSVIFNFSFALISYGVDGAMEALHGGTFVTVITAWPDITDKSVIANIARITAYLICWVCVTRVAAVHVLIIMTTGCLGYQYKNVQSYFYSLNDMFAEEGVGEMNRENVEQKYEEALKVGIQLHADTLWCTTQCQEVFGFVYSAQIILNVTMISLQMLQLVNAESSTLSTVLEIVLISAALLYGTGTLMWNAGDVTVEAALVPTAMYSSGWENCRGEHSRRVRKLLVIAMNQAQRHVALRTFGIMEISYQAYVSMVKASYSVFSVVQ